MPCDLQPSGLSVPAVLSPVSHETKPDGSPASLPTVQGPVPIELGMVLEQVGGRNPALGVALERVRAAQAALDAAEVLWLPSMNAGVSYNKHEGTLQASDGEVIDVSRASLQSGLGVLAIGAGSPIVPGLFARFHGADAVFEPRIAARAREAEQFAASKTLNDLLLDAALAYLELLAAYQTRAIATQTEQNAGDLQKLTADFFEAGEGPRADADRAKAERKRRQNALIRAEEEIEVAQAQLNQLLSTQSDLTLAPQETRFPILDGLTPQQPVRELIALGLTQRPELANQQARVAGAVERLRREQFAPLIPSVLLGVSYDYFGGGRGAGLRNNRDRFDLDAAVFWELRQLGLQDQAARDQARAQLRQEQMQAVVLFDRVAREITQAEIELRRSRERVPIAREAVASAQAAYHSDLDRIRNGEGLPIEAVQSLDALDLAQRDYLQSVLELGQAQFRLLHALGWVSTIPSATIDTTPFATEMNFDSSSEPGDEATPDQGN